MIDFATILFLFLNVTGIVLGTFVLLHLFWIVVKLVVGKIALVIQRVIIPSIRRFIRDNVTDFEGLYPGLKAHFKESGLAYQLMYKKVTIGKKEKLKEMGLYFMTADMYYIVEILILLYYTLVIVILEISLIPGDIFVAMLRELEQNYILDCMMGEDGPQSGRYNEQNNDEEVNGSLFIEILKKNGIRTNKDLENMKFAELDKIYKDSVKFLFRHAEAPEVMQGEINTRLRQHFSETNILFLKKQLWYASINEIFESHINSKPRICRKVNKILGFAHFPKEFITEAQELIRHHPDMRPRGSQMMKEWPWAMSQLYREYYPMGVEALTLVYPFPVAAKEIFPMIFTPEQFVERMLHFSFVQSHEDPNALWSLVTYAKLDTWLSYPHNNTAKAYLNECRLEKGMKGEGVISEYNRLKPKLILCDQQFRTPRMITNIFAQVPGLQMAEISPQAALDLDKMLNKMVGYHYEKPPITNPFMGVQFGKAIYREALSEEIKQENLGIYWAKTYVFESSTKDVQKDLDFFNAKIAAKSWEKASYFKRGCITIKDWFVK
jgi:hypothetical protein